MLVNGWLAQKGFLYDVVDGGAGVPAGTVENASGSSAPDTPDPAKNSNSGGITQDDLNKVAAKARSEGKQAALKTLLEELGIDTPDTLKSLVKAAKDRQDAELSEAQKLQKQLEKAQADLKAKEEAAQALEQTLRTDRMENEVRKALTDAKARKVEKALTLMRAGGKLNTLIADDGTVKADAVKQAVEEFRKEEPEEFALINNPGSPSNTGGRTPAPDSKDAEKASRGQRQTMRNW